MAHYLQKTLTMGSETQYTTEWLAWMASQRKSTHLDRWLASACNRVVAPIGYIGILSENLEIICADFGLPRAFELGRAIDRVDSISEMVAKEDRTFVVRDVQNENYSPVLQKRFLELRARAFIAAPLRLNKTIIGSVNIFDVRPRDFEHALASWLDERGDQAAEQVGRLPTEPPQREISRSLREQLQQLEVAVAELSPLVSLVESSLTGATKKNLSDALGRLGSVAKSYDSVLSLLQELKATHS